MIDKKDIETYYNILNGKENKHIDYLYARGYLISDKPYFVKQDWKSFNFADNYFITYDANNDCKFVREENCWCLILGTAMDTTAWHMNLEKIASNIAKLLNQGREKMYEYIDTLGGRHLIMYGDNESTCILQDAVGNRSCFYHKNRCLFASHYGIINDIAHCERHPFMAKFVKMENRPWILPGDITPYQDIMTLIPNHEIDVKYHKLHRFFPRKYHEDVSVYNAMEMIIDNIQNQMLTLSKYKKLMISITKGNDSRITMAASRHIKDDCIYYSYYGTGDPSQTADAKFCEKFAKNLGLQHILVNNDNREKEYDYDQLYSIAYNNFYHYHVFEAIPTYFEKLPNDRIAVRSNIIELIRKFDIYKTVPEKATYIDICKRLYSKWSDDEEVSEIFKSFYYTNDYDKLYNYLSGDILYWESRMGIWNSNGVLLKDDINFDTYQMFNCRKLLIAGLSMPRYFKQSNEIVYYVVNKLWPELLYYLPNEEYTLMDFYQYDGLKNMMEFGNYKIVSDKKNYYCKIGKYSASFGFGVNSVNKGDKISLILNKDELTSGVYSIQMGVFISQESANNIGSYRIKINDETVYWIGLTDFMDKDNQINIIKYINTNKLEICIEILVNKDFTSVNKGVPALINLKNVIINKQPNYEKPEQTLISSTREIYKTMVKYK